MRKYLAQHGFTDKQLEALKATKARFLRGQEPTQVVMVRILSEPLNRHQVLRMIRRANPARLMGDEDMLLKLAKQDIETIERVIADAGSEGVNEDVLLRALRNEGGPCTAW